MIFFLDKIPEKRDGPAYNLVFKNKVHTFLYLLLVESIPLCYNYKHHKNITNLSWMIVQYIRGY